MTPNIIWEIPSTTDSFILNESRNVILFSENCHTCSEKNHSRWLVLGCSQDFLSFDSRCVAGHVSSSKFIQTADVSHSELGRAQNNLDRQLRLPESCWTLPLARKLIFRKYIYVDCFTKYVTKATCRIHAEWVWAAAVVRRVRVQLQLRCPRYCPVTVKNKFHFFNQNRPTCHHGAETEKSSACVHQTGGHTGLQAQ